MGNGNTNAMRILTSCDEGEGAPAEHGSRGTVSDPVVLFIKSLVRPTP